MAEHAYKQITDNPTTEKATLLDLAFVKYLNQECCAVVLYTYYS